MKMEGRHKEGCESIRETIDSYVSSELSQESALAVATHLDGCPACRDLVKARIEVRESLRRAVGRQPAEADLRARVRSQVREASSRSFAWNNWKPLMAIAATLLAAFSGSWLVLDHSGEPWNTRASEQQSYIDSLLSRVAETVGVGLADHVHCAHFRKFPADLPTVEEITEKLGPDYAGLAPIVQKQVASNYDLSLAHQCRYLGRQYVHLAFRGEGKLLSLILTPKRGGESFARDGLAPVLLESGTPLYGVGVDRFAVAGFETAEHLVFVVSDLGEQQNLQLAADLVEMTRDYVGRLTHDAPRG